MDAEILIFYAQHLNWALFPCSSKNKAPLTEHGFKDATTDLLQLKQWHRQFPGCAWGTPTSVERGVIDIDPRNGGHESLAELIARRGPLPATPTVRTGGGGYHYWFKFPPGTTCGKLANGIDRKANGGYVIVPPSRIDSPEHQGRAYAWEVRPWEVAIADAPAWCHSTTPGVRATAKASSADPWIVQPVSEDDLLTHPGSPEGERRRTLCQLVGVHLARGDSEASIRTMAEAWAGKCKPPFEEWERHTEGLVRREAGRMTTLSAPQRVRVRVVEELGDTLLPGREQTNSAAPSPPELVCSLPPSAQSGEASGLSDEWPTLHADAYHGLLGEMLRAIEPETEADPAGILLGWLCCLGSIIGRGAWVQVGPRKHYPALYVGIVGRTSDAKGDCWAVSVWPFREVEAEWAGSCIANGVGSGEGLVERVADLQLDKDGNAQGATDKRCLVRLSELSRCFKLGRRENATLSEYLREAWDGEPIHVPNRKGNALSASDYTISLLGDITPGVLRKLLEGGTEGFDGHANRILWAVVKRSRFLPSGGSMEPLPPYLEPLAEALAFAKDVGEVRRDADAEKLWAEVYPALAVSGDSVPHTDRARPYVVRLSMLYALADKSQTIRAEHLRAALAVWEYCRQSARLIFCGQQEATPDPLWLRLLNAITKAPGISRTGLREVAGHKVPAEDIDAALGQLEAQGMAYRKMVQPEGGGRPAECWYPGQEPGPEGGSLVNDNHSASLADTASASAEKPGREGTNSAESRGDSGV